MTSNTIQITPISNLDWPSSPNLLPKATILVGGPSYLSYASRRKRSYTPLSHFTTNNTNNNNATEDGSHHPVHSSNTTTNNGGGGGVGSNNGRTHPHKSIDLTTLTPEELNNLTYYEILGGIPMHSTPEQIKRAFHKASLKYHPDKHQPQHDSNGTTTNTNNTNNTGSDPSGSNEDPVFLKVKEAFETLGNTDPSKRRAYDSTIDFDESIPSATEVSSEDEFYRVFGGCFERNLRFAAENDPVVLAANSSSGSGSGSRGGGGGGGKGKGKHQRNKPKPNPQSQQPPLTIGSSTTSLTDVNRFYSYWINFQSWRDFTLLAMEQTDNTDTADDLGLCRFQKRAVEQEIARRAKQLKKDEMVRITRLVERAMGLDPRLKREKQRLEREKVEKVRMRREEEERRRKEKEQREEEERKKKEEVERLEKERRAGEKAEREREKKVLRKARKELRSSLSSSIHSQDDVEFLCERLTAVQIEDLLQRLTNATTKDTNNEEEEKGGSSAAVAVVSETLSDLRKSDHLATQEEQRKRDAKRRTASEKEARAKAARASKPWDNRELAALIKAVKKYPTGGANRWDTIALFVNNVCRPEEPRSKEQCIEKYNQVTSAAAGAESSSVAVSSKNGGGGGGGGGSGTGATKAVGEDAAWTEEQIKLLQEGLAKYPASLDKNERWKLIAKCVPGKTKKECVQQFKAIRETLKGNK